MRWVILDGKRWPIREVLRIYKEQKAADRKARQMVLFEDLPNDALPKSQRTAIGRYLEPLLFD